MYLSKICVQNYRSIERIDIDLSSFNVFVGQNNHGKTNFFEAIEWFYIGKGNVDEIIRRGANDEIIVEIEFSEVQEGLSKMKNPKNQTTISKIIQDNNTARIKRSSNNPNRRLIFDTESNDWTDPGTGFDRALNDFLPKLEFIKTETHLKEVSKYGKNMPISEMLSNVLSAILEKEDDDYRNFKDQFDKLFGNEHSKVRMELANISIQVKDHLSMQFPDCTKVDFDVKQPALEDLLKNFDIRVDDGIDTTASEKGDGMQRALMLAIIQTYADFRRKHQDTKSFLFIIDEGELHLHPTAQRNLKNALLTVAKEGDQVMLSTHSSVLICDEEEIQSVFKVDKSNKITEITPVIRAHKQNIVYELLGGSPADLLLPRNFLIVEGKSEVEFLTRVIERHYPDKKNIQIVKALGDIDQAERLMNSIVKLFTPLNESIYKDRVVFMLDKLSEEKISEGAFTEFQKLFIHLKEDDHIFLLPVCTLEEYYPEAKEGQIAQNDVPKWRRSAEEAGNMNHTKKVKLARIIGEKITKDQFENDMPKVFEALNSCWHKAY